MNKKIIAGLIIVFLMSIALDAKASVGSDNTIVEQNLEELDQIEVLDYDLIEETRMIVEEEVQDPSLKEELLGVLNSLDKDAPDLDSIIDEIWLKIEGDYYSHASKEEIDETFSMMREFIEDLADSERKDELRNLLRNALGKTGYELAIDINKFWDKYYDNEYTRADEINDIQSFINTEVSDEEIRQSLLLRLEGAEGLSEDMFYDLIEDIWEEIDRYYYESLTEEDKKNELEIAKTYIETYIEEDDKKQEYLDLLENISELDGVEFFQELERLWTTLYTETEEIIIELGPCDEIDCLETDREEYIQIFTEILAEYSNTDYILEMIESLKGMRLEDQDKYYEAIDNIWDEIDILFYRDMGRAERVEFINTMKTEIEELNIDQKTKEELYELLDLSLDKSGKEFKEAIDQVWSVIDDNIV